MKNTRLFLAVAFVVAVAFSTLYSCAELPTEYTVRVCFVQDTLYPGDSLPVNCEVPTDSVTTP